MLPWDLEDWLSETADRVLAAPQPWPELDQLFREVWLFDTQYRNGGVSQYFSNYPERWCQLVQLTEVFLPRFSPVTEAILRIVSNAKDPYAATLARDEELGAVYETHRAEALTRLKETMSAA
jgi:hypothetical protein